MRSASLILVSVILSSALLLAQSFAVAFADNPGTYVWLAWPIDTASGNYNFDIDLQIMDAPQGASVYWAHQFSLQNGGGYMGLQIGTGWGAPPDGRGAIFAIWEATSATPGSGGECVPFSNEGSGWSCHLPYVWRLGAKYRLRIWVSGEDADNWGWLGSLLDYQTGQEMTIGHIMAPKRLGELGASSVTWVEYFGVDWNCAPPHTLAAFSNARVRNGQVDQTNGAFPLTAKVAYGQTCGKSSNVRYLGGTYYALEAGVDVQRTTTDGTWLWSSPPSSVYATTTLTANTDIPEFSSPPLVVVSIVLVLIAYATLVNRKSRWQRRPE